MSVGDRRVMIRSIGGEGVMWRFQRGVMSSIGGGIVSRRGFLDVGGQGGLVDLGGRSARSRSMVLGII